MLPQPDRAARGLRRLRLARRRGGADQHRVDGAADRLPAARQRRAAAGDRGRVRRAAGERDARRDRAAGDLGRRRARRRRVAGGDDAPRRRRLQRVARACPRRSPPRRSRARGRAADPPLRHPRHPLHLGHHRPGQGRALPAGAVPLVGRAQRRDPRRRRRRRALHDAAAVPHQRPQHLRPGLARRRPRRLRAALLGLGLLADDARARARRVVYLLGAMVPILLAQPVVGGGARRTACASASARACRRAPRRRSASAPACRCSKATARPRPTSSSPARPDRSRPGCMGWLRPGFEARVVDAHDVELPPGEAGELLLRADEPFAFASGYFGKPEATVAAWRNLWFHTGDRVVREADGAFRFVDRIKDAIRRRGENISSYEVEQVLQSHPAVAAVAVYPVRSELAEDEVMAAVVAREGGAIDPAELVALLPHAAAVLRDPALRRGRRRPAAHRERQGAEVQAARARRDAGRLGPAGQRSREGADDDRVLERRARDPALDRARALAGGAGDGDAAGAAPPLAPLRAPSRRRARRSRRCARPPTCAALPFTLKDDLRAAQEAASDDAAVRRQPGRGRRPTSSRRSRRRARPAGRSTTR